MSNYSKKFKKIYSEYYLLHPDADTLPDHMLYYLHRQWIFPNHIDVMLDYAEKFANAYYPNTNREVIALAVLLHDSGLIYRRKEASPNGHESRSCDYTKIILAKYGYSAAFIKHVCAAIKSTEPSQQPKSDEAIIVRNADAYSHLSTVHFFAKAHFAKNIREYINWLEDKVSISFSKLTIPDLIAEKHPLVDAYASQIALYKTQLAKSMKKEVTDE